MYRTISLKNREDWLQERLKYGMSSEAVAIMDVSAFKSAVEINRLKRGIDQYEELNDDELDWNRWREQEILDWWLLHRNDDLWSARLTGDFDIQVPEEPFKTYNGVEIPLASTIDAIGRMQSDEEVIVEIKTASEYSRRNWDDGAPDYVFWQVVHQMLVTGIEKAIVLASIGGKAPVHFWVEPDPSHFEDLLKAWESFWNNVWDDTDELPGWSTALSNVIPEQNQIENGDIGLLMAYNEYLEGKRDKLSAERRLKALKNKVLSSMPSKIVSLPNGTILEWQERSNGNYLIEKKEA